MLCKIHWTHKHDVQLLPMIDFHCLHLCREADKDMMIMGYRIPQGTPLMLAPYPMHVSPHNYIHPHKFWPDRWFAESSMEDNLEQSGSVLSSYAAFFPVAAAAICLLLLLLLLAVSAKVAACVIPACHCLGACLLLMVKTDAFMNYTPSQGSLC